MGPRLFSRGRLAADVALTLPGQQLQWGRGSSAAEGAGWRSTRPASGSLQWGRGSSAAEGSRTRQQHYRLERFNGAAALQPRKGRASRAPIRSPVELQWGRGSSAADGMEFCPLRCNFGSFNGAAALQPRKGRYPPPWSAKNQTLQWGRGSSAAEGNVCGSANHFVDSASMGPRLFSRGRFNAERGLPVSVFLLQWGRGSSAAEGRWVDVGSDAKSGRFNGAAALQPRKAARRNTILWVCRASMGPRLFSRGRDADVDGMFDLSDASMGPRLFSRGRSG